MIEINFAFREKLNSVIGGDHHGYCFQCGACVGDCPSARYTGLFSPRLIVLRAILGQEESLTGPESPIWLCTNCYNCYERCPQDVKPVEVIMALKNLAHSRANSPQQTCDMVSAIHAGGRTAVLNPTVDRRRQSLGLKPIDPKIPKDFHKLLEAMGVKHE
jgi:heterodisulfide reductase subunit C